MFSEEPRAHPAVEAPAEVEGELSDDVLDHVIGGLARAWDPAGDEPVLSEITPRS